MKRWMNTMSLLGAVIPAIAFLACQSPHPKSVDLTQVRKVIEETNAQWSEAMKRGDIDAIISLYAEDATVLPPNRPMLRGREQIRVLFGTFPTKKVTVTKAILNTLEVNGKDSTVYELGEYLLNYQREDGSPGADTGKYTTIWRLQSDGVWRMQADCWNSNKPLRMLQEKR